MPAAVTVTLFQQRTNEGPAGYKIYNELQTATGMSKDVFVYKSIDDTFSHVATPNDLFWPTVNTINIPYYRKDEAEKSYMNVNQAIEFAEHIKFRVSTLVDSMNEQTGPFVGSETTGYPGP